MFILCFNIIMCSYNHTYPHSSLPWIIEVSWTTEHILCPRLSTDTKCPNLSTWAARLASFGRSLSRWITFPFPNSYSWIGASSRNIQKINTKKRIRATKIPRPPFESSWRGESKSACAILCDPFSPLFQNNFPNNNRTKIVYTEYGLPCRILVCGVLRSFWGVSVRTDFLFS